MDAEDLPENLSDELLQRLDVPSTDRSLLLQCRTYADLMNCERVPQDHRERVINALLGANDPMRVLDSDRGLEDLAAGRRSYESFLIALDESQEPHARRHWYCD